MAEIIRTERSSVLWGSEATFGTAVTPSRRFGIHDTFVAADPEYKWYPFFGVGSQTRSRDTILRGPQEFRGSVPDIRLQANVDFPVLLGQMIGYNDGGNIVEHQFNGYDQRLLGMTVQCAIRDTANNAPLVRNYIGGKVNRASLSANEGEELRASLEDIMFLKMLHNRSGVFGYSNTVSAAADPGISSLGRFIFSGATINVMGMNVCRARRFNLSIDNQLEYRYYLCNTGSDRLQLPVDIIEGKRVYQLELDIDLGDPSTDLEFFDFLMLEGAASTSSKTLGTTIILAFQAQPSEGGGTCIITCDGSPSVSHPGAVLSTAKHSLPAPPAGLIPVTLSFDVRSVNISTSLGV